MSLIQGFLISFTLICAIGAQNAFVIKQGLLKNHVFAVALTCFICDCILIIIGVLGIGQIINDNIYILLSLASLGAVFLFIYGFNAFKSAYKGNSSLTIDNKLGQESLNKTLLMTLAVTLLNPHVYLDTVVIIGGVTVTLTQSEKIFFIIGASIASGTWFFGIAFGAKKLAKLFTKPVVWRVFDSVIGILMWAIALSLVIYIVQKGF